MANLYNIKQTTNYNLMNAEAVDYTIEVPEIIVNSDGIKEVIQKSIKKQYKTAVAGEEIIKLGYSCEPAGHIYPIYLEMNGEYHQIRIGKNGMYEMQAETYKEANSENDAETTDVIITSVRVPADVEFILDYIVTQE